MTIEAYQDAKASNYHYDDWGWDYYKAKEGNLDDYHGVKGKERYIRIDLQPSSDACQPFIDYSGVYLVANYTVYQDDDKHKLIPIKKRLRHARNRYVRCPYSFFYRERILVNGKDYFGYEENDDEMTDEEREKWFAEFDRRIEITRKLGFDPWDFTIQTILKRRLDRFWDKGLPGKLIGKFRKKIGRQLWRKITNRFRMKNFIHTEAASTTINCFPSKEFPVTLHILGGDDSSYMKSFSDERKCLDFIDTLKDIAKNDNNGDILDSYLCKNMLFTN